LGADHRKLELRPHHHQHFGDALAATLRHLAGSGWTESLETTLATAYRVVSTALQQGAASGHGPARVGATVVDVLRPTRDVVVVRLVTDVMVDYHPGQHLSVLTPYAGGVWRRMSPSIPANPAGQIEFHVREVPGGTLSGPLVRSAGIGDRWVLADPVGALEVDRSTPHRDVLMVAGGTGIAPLRCLLTDMQRHRDNPRVHLFYGARHPGDLYDLPALVGIASSSPWLTIQPVSESDTDPWWAGPRQELPRTLHRRQTGTLVEAVTGWGSWAARQVLVCGTPETLRATVRGMVAAGTPREHISFDRPGPGRGHPAEATPGRRCTRLPAGGRGARPGGPGCPVRARRGRGRGRRRRGRRGGRRARGGRRRRAAARAGGRPVARREHPAELTRHAQLLELLAAHVGVRRGEERPRLVPPGVELEGTVADTGQQEAAVALDHVGAAVDLVADEPRRAAFRHAGRAAGGGAGRAGGGGRRGRGRGDGGGGGGVLRLHAAGVDQPHDQARDQRDRQEGGRDGPRRRPGA